MLLWLYTYVANVCSQCFICYIASVFIWMLHMFYTYVASVLSRCCVCVATIFKCFFPDVFTSVLDACFKCFIYLQTYVASVVSGYFKSRSGVASPSSLSAASSWCLLLTFCRLASFLDCGGGTARAGEGGAPRPMDGTHWGIAARTREHAILFRWLETGRCVRMCCGRRTSRR